MTVKIQRKVSADPVSYKEKPARKIRNSTPKITSKLNGNGKHPFAAYEQLHIGIVGCSPDGKYIDANEEFCRILGYSKEELLQLSVKQCTHEEDYVLDAKLHEQLVAGKIPFYALEKRYIRKDGQIIWVELTRSLVRDEKGKPLCSMGVVIDISEYKQVERVLRESAENLRIATEAARMFKWELDFQKRLYTFADNFIQILGFSAGLLPQNSIETVWRLSPEEDVQVISKAIDEAIKNHSDLNSLQYRMINPEDGQAVWLEVNAKIVYDSKGNPKRMFGVAQNITEEKKAQEEIRILSKLPAENPNPVMRLTPDGKVLYANPPGQDLLEVWRQQAGQAVSKELQKNVVEAFASGLKKEIEIAQNGKIFSCTLAPVRESGYVNLYGNEITERKRAERAVTEFARRQEALYQLSDQLHHTNSLADVYNAALDAILSGLQCDRASILLFDDTDMMRFVAWQGLSDEYRKAAEGHSPWAPDEKNPYPICVSDIPASDLSDSLKATIQEEGIASLAFIPLLLNGKLIGKFMVYFDAFHECSDNEIELSLMIARQVAFNIDRKQAEEKLRASEALFRTIARSIPGGGVYVVDKDFRYIVAEGAVTEAFGLARENLEGQTVWEAFPDQRGERMRERLQRTYEGETVNFETEYNGHVYWTQQAPLRDALGQAIIVTIDVTERRRAEEALRQSEERFARFMQNLPGLAWIKDRQGRYVYANATAEKAFSMPREKLYGQTDLQVFPAEVAEQFRKNDEQALVNEKGVQTVETLPQEDGVVHYSLVTKFPIPDPDGNAAWIGGTAFDITERLQAEEALRESEGRFKAILRQATAGIVRKDAKGRFLFVNQAFCKMLGYTESELLGKSFWQFTYHEDREENKRLYDRMMLEGIPFKLEKRIIRKDGSLIWVDVSLAPVMDAEGKPQSAVAVEVDITGRKRAEEALQQLNLQLESRVQKRTATIQAMNHSLREEVAERKRAEEALRVSEAAARASEEKLRTLFDLLPVGISFLDPEGQVIEMNSALLNILKLSREQILSQAHKSRKYVRLDGTPMPPSEFAGVRALAENQTIYNVETGITQENGEIIWTSVSAAPVDVADVGAVVVTADITKSKRAEHALQESHRRLRALSQRLVEVQEEERRALARELHDRVGQTLAALNINLIIIDSQLSADLAQQIGARLNDSMKLVGETIALVRDVMTDLRPAVLDDYGLEAALESYLSGYKSRYNLKVEFEKPERPIPRLGPSVEMTFLRIAQEAFMNIAKHARAEHVNLSLRQEEEANCLTIQDDGIGIESGQDANRPSSHGLTIMRERAEAFGGTLKVQSIPNQGTVVEVSIPFNKSDSQDKAQKEQNS